MKKYQKQIYNPIVKKQLGSDLEQNIGSDPGSNTGSNSGSNPGSNTGSNPGPNSNPDDKTIPKKRGRPRKKCLCGKNKG